MIAILIASYVLFVLLLVIAIPAVYIAEWLVGLLKE